MFLREETPPMSETTIDATVEMARMSFRSARNVKSTKGRMTG
jgi:hypothetical protein